MRRLRLFALSLLCIAATPFGVDGQAAKVPVGTYEVVADSNYNAGFDVTGLVIEFTDTTMTATQNGNMLVHAKVSIDGDVITLNDLDGVAMCVGEGKYKVVPIARGLRLRNGTDACEQRLLVLSSVSLIKRG
jgi:hypothetical protein